MGIDDFSEVYDRGGEWGGKGKREDSGGEGVVLEDEYIASWVSMCAVLLE